MLTGDYPFFSTYVDSENKHNSCVYLNVMGKFKNDIAGQTATDNLERHF